MCKKQSIEGIFEDTRCSLNCLTNGGNFTKIQVKKEHTRKTDTTKLGAEFNVILKVLISCSRQLVQR